MTLTQTIVPLEPVGEEQKTVAATNHTHGDEKATCHMCSWHPPPCYQGITMLLDHTKFQIPASKVPSQMLLHIVLSYYFGIGYCHYDFSLKDKVYYIYGASCLNKTLCRHSFAGDYLYSDDKSRQNWSDDFFNAWTELLDVVEEEAEEEVEYD